MTLVEKLIKVYKTGSPLSYSESNGIAALNWSQEILRQLEGRKEAHLNAQASTTNVEVPTDNAIALPTANLDIEFLELDNPDLYFLKALLETHYTDGITNIRDVDLDDRDNIVGIFEDKVSPTLTKYFRFRIDDLVISSQMLNPEAIEDFATTSLEFKTASSKRNCVKGRACGNSCIPASRACKTDVPPAAKQQLVVVKMKLQAKKKAPKPGTVADVAIADLNLDPTRFQYKLVHGSSGSSGSLTGVRKWDPNLAGIVQVWRDPADGKDYIVNGHNRANLAKGLGVDKITVRYLDVKDAAEARAVGALTNIAEGRGLALDAAKFFKDSGLTKADLDAKGIPMREKIATDGLALSSLDDSLFRKVIDGDIPTERATIIGGSGLDHTQQRSLVDLIEKEERRKKKITNDTIRELADGVKASSQRDDFQMDLFGGSQKTVDNAIERASLQAHIKQRLSRDKKLFGTVSKSKAASDLQKAGNVIDIATSQKISQDAATTLAIFDQLKNLSGPVSKALNDAADRIIAGDSPKKVQDDLYKQITDELPKLVGSKPKATTTAPVPVQAALFGETLEYARLKLAGNTKQTKTCSKGYSCGYSCINKNKACTGALPGQAKNYADWLSDQIKGGGKLSPAHTKEAENRGLIKNKADAIAKYKGQIESYSTPLPALEVIRAYIQARQIDSSTVATNATDDNEIAKFRKRTKDFDGLPLDLKKRMVEDVIDGKDFRDYAWLSQNLTSDGKLDLAMAIVGDTSHKQAMRLKSADSSKEFQSAGILTTAIKREFKDDVESHKELIKSILDKAFTEIPLPPAKKAAVSEAFSSITGGTKKMQSTLEDALKAIDKVHDDGDLSKIPLKVNAQKTAQATFRYTRGVGGSKPHEITVSKHTSDPEFSLAHEIGHFLDFEALGSDKGKYASNFDPELADWRKAVTKSDAIQRIIKIKKDGGIVEVTDSNSGTINKYKFSQKYINYTLETHEIFARSYAQYIATKSNHPGLKAGLQESQKQNEKYPYQWSNDDFKPIAAELDKLFKKKGWIQ